MAVDLFAVELLGKPFWLWLLFLGIVLGLLAFDLGVLHRRTRAR
jgi:tellurite resistance protein TerC